MRKALCWLGLHCYHVKRRDVTLGETGHGKFATDIPTREGCIVKCCHCGCEKFDEYSAYSDEC